MQGNKQTGTGEKKARRKKPECPLCGGGILHDHAAGCPGTEPDYVDTGELIEWASALRLDRDWAIQLLRTYASGPSPEFTPHEVNVFLSRFPVLR